MLEGVLKISSFLYVADSLGLPFFAFGLFVCLGIFVRLGFFCGFLFLGFFGLCFF